MACLVNATPGCFNTGKGHPALHCMGGWVNTRADLDGCEKSRTHRDSIPGPCSPQKVATPTTLSKSLL